MEAGQRAGLLFLISVIDFGSVSHPFDFGGFFPGGGFGFAPGGAGFGAPSGGGPSGVGAALFANRLPLALLFFTLEALVFGAAAAWVWAHNAPVEQVADEVLSP